MSTERWQKTFALKRRSKGVYLVTREILEQLEEGLKDKQIAMLYLFLQHTSAGLSINENCDPDVRSDMDMALDTIVPESLPWQHVDEGPDDSVSHTKSSIIGVSLCIPISRGKLALGTWQGVYLHEFRNEPHTRRIVATII